MEIRDFALLVLTDPSFEARLADAPEGLTDEAPVPENCPAGPIRPAGLEIVTDRKSKRKVPSLVGLPDPAQRVRILHGFANHELQAIELFAWALLRFPDAPTEFRRGLLRILGEEQRHLRMYLEPMEALGGQFGDEPLSGYFWSKVPEITTMARFVCAVGLTFENANLDHALDFEARAHEIGDSRLGSLLRKVHDDEIGHVRFGWHWLASLRETGQSMTEAYLANVIWPLRPQLARGPNFHRESREQAGMDQEFIELLEQSGRPSALYRFDRTNGNDSRAQ